MPTTSPQFDPTTNLSNQPILVPFYSGSLAFLPPGISTSSFYVTGAAVGDLLEASSAIILESDPISGRYLQFRTPSSSLGTSDDKIQFFISNSIAPKIGIGTSNPLATLDIVDVENTAEGFVFLIRNARTVTKGGDPGDAAGTINFIIDSGSYDKITTSGSVGKIVSEVDAINTEGVGGHIRFEVSDTNTSNLSNNPVEVLRLVKDSSDIDDVTVKVTGSLSSTVKIKAGTAVEAGTYVDANTYLRGNSLKIGVTTEPGSGNAIILGDLKVTNITGSIISASGAITGSDVYIDDWGSVSASLSSAGGGGAVATYTNGVDNRIITSTGTDSINGEANLTFDGSTFELQANAFNIQSSTFNFNGVPAGTDNTVLILNSSDDIVTDEIDSRVWGTSLVDKTGTPLNNQIAIFTDSNTVEGDADLTWNGTILTVAGIANIDSTQIANANSGGTLSSAGDYGAGSQIYKDSGFSNVQAGKIYYATGTGTWALASSGSEAAASGLLAIATGTNSLDGMLLNGIVKLPTNITGTIGDKIYLSGPAGSLTTTLPSTAGSFIRIVGHLINATDDTIYFNPSNDYIELV